MKLVLMSSSGRGEALGKKLGGVGFTGSVLEPADLKGFVDAAMARFGRIPSLANHVHEAVPYEV